MVWSTPASLNALSKYGRSSLSHRGELALSGRRTQISLSHEPPEADVPVPAAPVLVSSSPPHPAARAASAKTSASSTRGSRLFRRSVLAHGNFLTLSSSPEYSPRVALTRQRYGGRNRNARRTVVWVPE